ncbi:MAG TPA: TonB-dependent receptor [Terriglobia bacterium]|nr:TonB-dependent receptor [Terriglobia bacterium]
MLKRQVVFLVTLFCFLVPAGAFAQGALGTITGTVRDASGAVVPGTSITLTEVSTGIARTVTSSSAGYYRVSVPPGTYRIEATRQGFKAGIIDNIIVPVAQVITEDLALEVGAARQSVTVTSAPPLLTPDTAEISTSMSPKEFATLPISLNDGGRQLQTFIFTSLPGATGDTFAGSLNGGQLFSSEIMIDGISIGRYDLNGGSLTEFTPSTDAIGEFNVQMSSYSAEYGNTGGGVQNFVMKSGTNQWHGTLYEYLQNEALNAAGFTNNAFGGNKPSHKDNDFGGAIGGPIKKDRTFFYFTYEGDRFRSFNLSGLTTLPTVGMKQGDFSGWQGAQVSTCDSSGYTIVAEGTTPCIDPLGRPVYENAIYNPLTTRNVAAGAVDPVTGLTNTSGADAILRDPFSGNVIPSADFSTASASLAALFPNPQYSSLIRNQPAFSGCCPVLNVNHWSLKMDHVINAEQRISGSFSYIRRVRNNRNSTTFPPYPGYPINPIKEQIVGGPMARFSYNWTINDHTINNLSLGYNRFINNNNATPNAQYAKDLGISGVDTSCFPPFNFSGHVGQLGRYGVGCYSSDPSESYILTDTLAYLRGKHSFKFGGEFRRYRYNTFEPGNLGGTFTFSDRETSLPGFTSVTGIPFASFMLGAVDTGSRSIYNTEPGYRAGVLDLFALDDWKVSRKLTLNIGIRYDLPLPKKEAFNRMSGLDPTLANPGADGIPGALTFLGNCTGCNGRNSFQNMYWKEIAPRIGLAYQISKNLVFRGGYGISYSPPILNNFGTQNIFGFNATVPLPRGTSGTGFNLDPVTYWSALSGATIPAGAQTGVPAFSGVLPEVNPALANGNGIDYLPSGSLAQPYVQNWNAGFQYMLPKETLLEVNYVGSKGSRLLQSMFSNMFNQVPTKYMGLGDLLGADLATALADSTSAATLAQYGITGLPYASFESTNFNPTVAQALRPFPQYDAITNNYPTLGSSTYHALQATVRKRASKGLNFIGAYTYSKTLTNADTALYYPTGGFGVYNFGQDFYNRAAEKSIASFDYTHVLKLTWIYDLPFGPGQKFLGGASGVAGKLLGGWTVTAIQSYTSGDPLAVSTDYCTGLYSGPYGDGCGVRPNSVGGVNPALPQSGLDAVNGTTYLNPAAFSAPATTPDNGYAVTFGNAPRIQSNIRGPSHANEDFGILKKTSITESSDFEFRADFFNVFNRVGRGNPDTDLTGGTFGLIFGPQHGGRVIQFSARINF